MDFFHRVPEFSVYVSADSRRLILFQRNVAIVDYPVSLSKWGMGNKKNSFMTPWGMHRICEKIGAGIPDGGIFRARQYTGENFRDATMENSQDIITSRILRLEGLENGINGGGDIDSYQRYIYIHGTNEEHAIGENSSHGCIRMINADIVRLFDRVSENTPVCIAK